MSEKETNTRVIKTLHFGDIEAEPNHIYHFQNGMLGFDDLHDYILISEESTEPFKWLISVDSPQIGFPLLSPWHLDIGYEPDWRFNMHDQAMFVVITLEDENGNMSANMKAPVILNIETNHGEQVILPSDKYTTNFIIPKKNKD